MRLLPKREVIGMEECPILYRWTLLKVPFIKHLSPGRDKGRKVLLHHFLPESRDRDPHDHPWSFITFVFKGDYVDESWPNGILEPSVIDHMRAGDIAYRPAHHTHTTVAGPKGAWTLVLTFGKKREWGFWRNHGWWPWKQYEERYGAGMRCDD